MTKRKFHRYVVQVEVLSEEELSAFDLEDLSNLGYLITEGGCSGQITMTEHHIINGKQAAEALQGQASDPEFFSIDEDGNDVKK